MEFPLKPAAQTHPLLELSIIIFVDTGPEIIEHVCPEYCAVCIITAPSGMFKLFQAISKTNMVSMFSKKK